MALNFLKKVCCMFCFFVLLVTWTAPVYGEYGEGEVISLSRAKSMARRQGPDLERIELDYEIANERLAKTRSDLGIGVYDSDAMRRDMEELEKAVEEWEEKIADQEKIIADLRQEKEELEEELEEEELEEEELEEEELEEDETLFKEIQDEIDKEQQQLEKYREELTDLRKARSNILVRYRSTKVFEDRFEDQLDPMEKSIESLEDTLEIQPRLIDYMVEELYFNQLMIDERDSMLQELLSYEEMLKESDELRLELGLIIPSELEEAEERIRNRKEALYRLDTERQALARNFKKLLGLDLDDSFQLRYIQPPLPDMDKMSELPPPDLKDSVKYRRAEEDLVEAEEELEDTSERDVRKYRLAALEVEKAEMELEETLKELEKNYRNEKEALELGRESYLNVKQELDRIKRKFALSEKRHDLGALSGLALEAEKMELLEKELEHYQARVNFYMQEQAYYLARDGIEADVRTPAGAGGQASY